MSLPPTDPKHHTSRRYEVRHRTEYTYEADVTVSFARACLRPRDTATQRVLTHRIDIEPTPDVLEEHRDFFGNYSHHLEISTPHRRLLVNKTSTVQVDVPAVDLAALDEWSVSEAVDALRTDPSIDPVEKAAFTLPSPLVTLNDVVMDFSRTLVWPGRPLGEAIAAVVHDIYTEFTYAKGVTSVASTLTELLRSRAGVCQDFAHLAVACLRGAGLPARYVSGYLETQPPPGRKKLVGSDASHAWAAVQVPGGAWIDLDPTNDHLADSRYITTAWGRDFRDVSPLKGVIFSEGKSSTLSVGVDVIRLPDEPAEPTEPTESEPVAEVRRAECGRRARSR